MGLLELIRQAFHDAMHPPILAEPVEVDPSPFADWVWPMPGRWKSPWGYRKLGVSSQYSKNGSGPNKHRPDHHGVDLMYKRIAPGRKRYPEFSRRWWCPKGVPCFSPGPGLVTFARWRNDRWISVVDHGVIDGMHLRSWTSHCDDLFVKPGQHVEAGQTIGTVGMTGTSVYHLHFGMRDLLIGDNWKSQQIDPEPLLRRMSMVDV